MKSHIATLNRTRIAVVLVESGATVPGRGDELIAQLQPHFPTLPIMLVSAEPGEHMGLRAYAHFQYRSFLLELLLQPEIAWADLPLIPEQPLPF